MLTYIFAKNNSPFDVLIESKTSNNKRWQQVKIISH